MEGSVTASKRFAFALLLLLSGFCGISYEVLYARILSNSIGDQFAVSAATLVTFMLGIGCGTLFAHRLWRHLWAIEGLVGAFGAAFALGSPALDRLYYASASPGSSLGGAMVFCFVLLIGPAFLIGCSLPLFAGYLGRLVSGAAFSRAYMIYNFGAALTVVVIEFYLFRMLGLRATVLTMAALNGLVCLSLLLGFREPRARVESTPVPLALPRREWWALALASVASAVFQLLMVKIAECFLGPFRETFALVVAIVLFGIAVGSAWLARRPARLGSVLLGALLGIAWLLFGFEWVTRGYAALKPLAVHHGLSNVLLRVGALLLLMGLPAIAFGATVPALLRRHATLAKDPGRALFVSSIANAAGFLLMAFVLHRFLDYGPILLVIAALTALAFVVASGARRSALAAGVALLLTCVVLERTLWDEKLLYLSYEAFKSSDDFAWHRKQLRSVERFKGNQDIFALNHVGHEVHFFINGYVSIALESSAERVVGAFPSLFAPRTDRALVLGVGSGVTTGTVALLFDHVDAVEINPVVLANLDRMSEYNFGLRSRANATLSVDDAIHFVRVHPETYSLIISTVTSPLYFSSAKLYTRDFFESVRRRLTPDGVYVTWVDMRVGQRGLDIMLKTATRSFRHCALAGVNSGYLLLLCSDEPLRLRRPELAAGSPPLAAYFEGHGLEPALLAYGLLSTRAADAIRDGSVPINTRDYPALEFQAALLDDANPDDFADQLLARMSLDDLRTTLAPALALDPIALTLYAEALYEDSDILDRFLELAALEVPDFTSARSAARLEYWARLAARANSATTHHLYGHALFDEKRYEDVLRENEAVLALDPFFDDAHVEMGLALERLGRPTQALEHYQKELALDPDDWNAAFGVGRALYDLKQYREALPYLERTKDHVHGRLEEEDAENEVDTYLSVVRQALGTRN